MTKHLDRGIEVAWIALFVATIFSAPLRDLAAGALLLLLLVERRTSERPAPIDRFDVAAGIFLAVTVATAALGGGPQESLLELRFYPIGLLLFLGARHIVAGGRAAVVLLTVLLLVDVLALDLLAQVASGTSPLSGRGPVWRRYTGSFPFPSDVSLLPILLPLAIPLGVGRGKAPAAVLIVTLALVGAAVVASGTRAAVLGLVFLAGAALVDRRTWMPAVMLTLGGALVALVAAGPAARLLGRGTGPDHRLPQWRAAAELAAETPLLGHGPHRFRSLLIERRATPLYRRVDLRYAPYPHSVYLETLVGSGLAGLGAWLWLLAQPFRAPAAGAALGALRAARVAVAVFAWIALFDLSLKKDWVELALWTPLGVAAGAATPRDRSREGSSPA